MSESVTSERFTVQMKADVEPGGRDTNGKLKVLLRAYCLTPEEIANIYRFDRPASVIITLEPERVIADKKGQLTLSDNIPCPKCKGQNTNVTKWSPDDHEPEELYCADCDGTLCIPKAADENNPLATVPEVVPGIVIWRPTREFAQIAAMDSRESVRKGEITGFWQPDGESGPMYAVIAVYSGANGADTATLQRIVTEEEWKTFDKGAPTFWQVDAENTGWQREGWFMTFGDRSFVTTAELVTLKGGTPPSYAVQWKDGAKEETGLVEESVCDTIEAGKALAEKLNDTAAKSATPGMTYTVVEWRPWVIDQFGETGELIHTSQQAYPTLELAEVACAMLNEGGEGTFEVRLSTAADEIVNMKDAETADKPKCSKESKCPYPMTQEEADIKLPPFNKCERCDRYSILPPVEDAQADSGSSLYYVIESGMGGVTELRFASEAKAQSEAAKMGHSYKVRAAFGADELAFPIFAEGE